MATSYGYHDNEGFIEDVHPPEVGDGFDVRASHVRHQAIGTLDERYLRVRSLAGASGSVIKIPVWAHPGYTRTPPLTDSDALAQPLRRGGVVLLRARLYLWRLWLRLPRLTWLGVAVGRTWRAVLHNAGLAAGAIGLAFAAVGTTIRHPSRLVTPSKYSASRGVYPDWRTAVWNRLKWAILPAVVFVALLFLLAIPLERSTTTYPTTPTNPQHHSQIILQTSKNSSSSAGNSAGSGTSSSNTSSSAPAAHTGSAQAPTSSSVIAPVLNSVAPTLSPVTSVTKPVTAPVTGNTGGGSSTTPTTVSSGSTTGSGVGESGSSAPSGGSSSLLPTTSVTVPPVSVNAGGKPLLNTSGTNLAIN